MPSLKDMRVRIAATKATQKITKAMQMVAASKLRRAQAAAEAARPYAQRMMKVLGNIAAAAGNLGARANALMAEGKEVRFFCVGRKGYEQLRRLYEKQIIEHIELRAVRTLAFEHAEDIGEKIVRLYEQGAFDVCTLFFSRFRSVIAQIPTAQQIIPPVFEGDGGNDNGVVYEYEPDEDEILVELLPRNICVQIFRALLENAASFYGAQMTAMDNATRNAGEMIRKQTLTYNRTRQAMITKELIEIISGAEAV